MTSTDLFSSRYTDAYQAEKWPSSLRIYPGRETVVVIACNGIIAGVDFTCEVRSNKSANESLFACVVAKDEVLQTVTVTFPDDLTGLADGFNPAMAVLDATIAGEKYPFVEGEIPVEPYGTGLPAIVTETTFQSMLTQLEAIRDQVLAAAAIEVEDILTSTETGKALSANQGRVLKELIDAINLLLASDESTLDDLQEIVDFIQINRATLDALSIASIAGLQTALDNITNNLGTASALDVPVSGDATAGQVVKGDDSRLGSSTVAWDVTQTSSLADGASASAFDFNTLNTYSLGKIVSFKNNGVEVLSLDPSSINVPQGSAAKPGLRFVGDSVSSRGIYRLGGAIHIQASSNNWMSISTTGSLQLNGTHPKLVNTHHDGYSRTSNHSINSSGRQDDNVGASGAVTWTLPASPAKGFHGVITRVESHTCTLQAPAGVELIHNGSKLAAGSSVDLTTDYSALSFVAITTTLWRVDTLS